MAASSAPTVKANLLAILKARPALAAVQIEWAHPGELQQESIFFGSVVNDEEAVALGQQSRDETYELECVVFCAQDGSDAQGAEGRMWALYGEIEQALQADPLIGGALNQWALIVGFTQTPWSEQGQVGSEVTARIKCKHRK